MKRLLLIILALSLCCVAEARRRWVPPSGAAPVEQIWNTPYGSTLQDQLVDEDFSTVGPGAIVDQFINNTDSSARLITKVSILINETSGSAKNFTCELRSAANGGGTLYATSTVSVPYTGSPAYIDFHFSCTMAATTDFFVSLSTATAGERWEKGHGDFSGNLYVNSTYCTYVAGVAAGSYDQCFKIYITQ